MKILRIFLAGVLIGFLLCFGWQWLEPIYHDRLPLTLSGAGQAYRGIDWLAVWFFTGFFTVIWMLYAFLYTREGDSSSYRNFNFGYGLLDDLWDLLTFWRR